MTDRSQEDNEVASLIAEKGKDSKKSEDVRKVRARSPSQSPVTVQTCESLFGSAEEKEKWKSAGPKWIKDIESGYFNKIEMQFEASISGYGLENGIELDMSGSAEEDLQNGTTHIGDLPADRAAVAAEYWQEISEYSRRQEVSAKTNSSNSRASVAATTQDQHENQLLARPHTERNVASSPVSNIRTTDQTQQLLRDNYSQLSQRFSPRPDMSPGYMNNALGGDSRQARSPGILQLNRGPVLRPSGTNGNRTGAVQTGYMRNARFDDRPRDFDQLGDGFRDSRNRNNSESNSLRSRGQGINLGPYEDLFRNPLPGGLKFIDSHAHWCFTIKKLQTQGIETYRDMRNSFPEMFPPSYGGSVQVFCLPLYLKSYDHWYRKLIEGTENELWFTYGCHPNFVDDWNDDVKQGMQYSMRTAHELDRLVGLGEIGLDYNRQNNNIEKKQRQREVFKIQLEMAVRHNLPIVIHCRNDEGHQGNNQAELDCFDIMTQHVPHDWKIHRHCFRGSYAEATKWMNHFPKVAFGFTPCIGGNKDLMAREAVKQLPLDKVLLETDAPYYTPAAMSNFPMESAGDKQPRKVAIPGGIALVTAHEISKLKDIPLETVVERTRENTIRLYGLSL